MFPSAVIKKDKKKLQGAKKVPPTPFKGVEEVSYEPMEGTMSLEAGDLEVTKKVKPSDVPKAMIPKSEDLMGIDLMLKGAKKSKANAVSSEGEEFEVEKTPEGKWKESGAEKERYLKAIGKLKKKK